MKKLTQLFILMVLPMSFAQAQKNQTPAPAANIEPAAVTQAKDLKSVLMKQKLNGKEISAAYSNLEQLIDNKVAPSVKELLELCLLYSKFDQSDAPYHLANTLKDSSPAEFEEALNQMSKEDAAKIRDFVKISESMGEGSDG